MTSVVEPLADLIREHYLFADRAESLAQQVRDGPPTRLQILTRPRSLPTP